MGWVWCGWVYELGSNWVRAGNELEASWVRAEAQLGCGLGRSWVYELGIKFELDTTGVRTGNGLPGPWLPSPFIVGGGRTGGRSHGEHWQVLIGGLKKRIAETQ